MSGSLVTDAGQTIVSGALPLALGLAALAGLVSFASPCVLPLVPGYLGFVSGMAAGDRASSRRWRTAVGALLFVAGFTAVFVLMALFVTSVGRGLWEHKDLLMPTVPTTLVLDPQGRIAARIAGTATEVTLTGLIDDVLAEA